MSAATLVLASASPRRRDLLASAGLPFQVVVPEVTETLEPELSSLGRIAIVCALAERKARAAVPLLAASGVPEGAWILGADTLVEVDGEILGKPADEAEARSMLTRLSGRAHRVSTGLALIPGVGSSPSVEAATTEVVFRPLTETDLEWYLASGEWRGVAGAYRIQERAALFVSGITGSHSSVVGLPLELLYGMLIRHRYRFI